VLKGRRSVPYGRITGVCVTQGGNNIPRSGRNEGVVIGSYGPRAAGLASSAL
jgi:hypothetical protein